MLLSACLSCDGCLSDEDTLKISQQGLEEVERVLALNKVRCRQRWPQKPGQALFHVLNCSFPCAPQRCDVSKHRVLVASVCLQSLPFFAVKFGVDVAEAAQKLCGFLKHIGELSFM